ncbi:M23 family metallopeptidase [Streptomyces sp. HNM0574]|uniref:peptidoglycan DD-metalloendopeptidase family protein n=1 Tax=Streptomyces sp. HNM0574 TaxID=2714954 RepID=UPI00146F4F21|nr:M23 family metallopeptidase [Streptomyces sp. HNM0574]
MKTTRKLMRPAQAVVAGSAVVALGAGISPAGAASPGAPAVEREPVAEAAAKGKPKFQMPFRCKSKMRLDTWGHSPALDMVKKGNPGSAGKAVVSSYKGKVVGTYYTKGSGHTIQIKHKNGWFTAYYHLKDDANTYVKEGQKVKRGKKIGRIGASGATTHAHLHYEQRYKKSGNWTGEKHRKAVHFNGKKYTGANNTWKSVTSKNC